ncbi:unnamed protein product [Clonostachys byssicola]|uniref:Uncharacterized protein n=1 Tax=Clonostachys byssicola TaxID=160290 RepID=A0A9N9U9C5_9HYPO|nr:unnamed protein product [Clonostachys byssicola]
MWTGGSRRDASEITTAIASRVATDADSAFARRLGKSNGLSDARSEPTPLKKTSIIAENIEIFSDPVDIGMFGCFTQPFDFFSSITPSRRSTCLPAADMSLHPLGRVPSPTLKFASHQPMRLVLTYRQENLTLYIPAYFEAS